MEPLTAIAVIATKYGMTRVVGALTGDGSLGGLAAELVGAMAASEDRLGERLAGIERQLDEVLERPYTTVIGTGLRTLLDAGTTADPRVRTDELLRARDLFREAASAARSMLQAAVAERYLAVCAIALGRPDAARTALRRLNGAAFEALLDASRSTGWDVRKQARVQLGQPAWSDFGRRRDQVTELSRSVAKAAADATTLAGNLLCEAGALAEGLGDGEVPYLDRMELTNTFNYGLGAEVSFTLKLWQVVPRESTPARFGPLTVTWHSVRLRPETAPAEAELHVPKGLPPEIARHYRDFVAERPPGLFDHRSHGPKVEVDVTVQAEPVLSQPVGLAFEAGHELAEGSWTLQAGASEIRLSHAVPTNEPSPTCTLVVGDVVRFRSA